MNWTDIFLIAWACVLFIAAVVAAYSYLSSRRSYTGKEVELIFAKGEGRIIDIDSKEPVKLEAAASRYFRLSDGKTHLYGIPQEPPLRHSRDDYFYLEPTEIRSGQWEVKDGSGVTFRLTCPQPFSARVSLTGGMIASHLSGIFLVAAIVWVLARLIVAAIAK